MPAWIPLVGKAAVAVAKVVPAKPVVDAVAKVTTDAAATRRKKREQREHAERLARQVGGKLSETSLVGSQHVHLVVWKDGKPFAAFPHTEGSLTERPELAAFPEDLLFDPPPARLPRHARKSKKRG
jgi:hypothetical protein